jgi:hypothetical protein
MGLNGHLGMKKQENLQYRSSGLLLRMRQTSVFCESAVHSVWPKSLNISQVTLDLFRITSDCFIKDNFVANIGLQQPLHYTDLTNHLHVNVLQTASLTFTD